MNLEARYRRITRLFPSTWRRNSEDELIATLLEMSAPGQHRVALRDTINLLATAIRLHARSVARSRRQRGVGVVAALAILAGTALTWRTGAVPMEFLVTSTVVAAIPGTGVFYTISRSIGGGWQRGVVAAVGCTLGIVPHIVAAMLGLSGIMQIGAAVFEVMRYAGVAYLIFMGVTMIRDRGEMLLGASEGAPDPLRQVVKRGILLNLLNPKLTLFFFAFLPPFLDPSPQLLDPKLVGLGAVFMIITFIVFAIYAFVSAAIGGRVLGAPVARRWFQRVLGSLLIGFGVKLAVD
jgi:threonine/homoserine/homoserine lactone efflux protein